MLEVVIIWLTDYGLKPMPNFSKNIHLWHLPGDWLVLRLPMCAKKTFPLLLQYHQQPVQLTKGRLGRLIHAWSQIRTLPSLCHRENQDSSGQMHSGGDCVYFRFRFLPDSWLTGVKPDLVFFCCFSVCTKQLLTTGTSWTIVCRSLPVTPRLILSFTPYKNPLIPLDIFLDMFLTERWKPVIISFTAAREENSTHETRKIENTRSNTLEYEKHWQRV